MVATAVFARPSRMLLECRGVVAGCLDRLLGDRLESDDLVDCPADSSAIASRSATPAGESGVHQPVRHLGIRQEQPGQRALGVLAATIPVSVSVGVPRQPEQRCAVRADREPELGVERRIEVGQWVRCWPRSDRSRTVRGRGLPASSRARGGPPAARSRCARPALVLIRSSRARQPHTLQASRNFSASSSALRSP